MEEIVVRGIKFNILSDNGLFAGVAAKANPADAKQYLLNADELRELADAMDRHEEGNHVYGS